MGIEAGDGVYLTYRNVHFDGQGGEFFGWQIAELPLNGSEFIKQAKWTPLGKAQKTAAVSQPLRANRTAKQAALSRESGAAVALLQLVV